MLGGWLRWWRRGPSPLASARVVVYTKPACPLCDKAAAFLVREQLDLGFSLEYADITGDPDLMRQYGDWVPVVQVNGKTRFRGAVNPVLWRRLTTALQR